MTKEKPTPSSLSPTLIKTVNRVGIAWFIFSAIGLAIFLIAQLPRLSSMMWLYMPGGRTVAPSANAFPTSVVVIVAAGLVLLLGLLLVLSRFKSRANGSVLASGLVVLIILFSWVTSVSVTIIVCSALSQVGLSYELTKNTAFGLIANPTQYVSFIVGALSLSTALGLPVLLSNIHKRDA